MRKGSAVSEPAYLQLDPDVEQAIAENLRCGRMHPRSFPDEQVLRREDNPHDAATLARPAFSRDIDKIMNIPAYNRYAGRFSSRLSPPCSSSIVRVFSFMVQPASLNVPFKLASSSRTRSKTEVTQLSCHA